MCVWYSCACRGSKYFKVVFDWLISFAGLCEIILGGLMWTQFGDVVVLAVEFLAVVFFVSPTRRIGFQSSNYQ